MKETTFINQNKKKWAKFERMSKQNQSDPDELSDLFIEITDDLAYARTHYSKRSVKVYLNSLAQKSFHGIYKKKRTPFSVFIQFWTTSLPLEMYRIRKALLASFIVFGVGMLIGIVSTVDDPDFLGAVIGYDYVDMTENNIAKGEPMGVYGSNGGEMTSFISIAQNNLRVTLMAFVLGIFFSVGSVIYMFFNGIMVGAFQWFFKVRGLLLTSFLTIWVHGAFEISGIVIAGAAGITLGNGFMFPGTLTRMQSLSIAAKRGVKVIIGLFPVILFAAFIEGFASRHTEWPDYIKGGIILLSFAIMVFYFVIYPYMVANKHNFDGKVSEKPTFVEKKSFELYKVRDLGDVFTDTFVFYRMFFRYFSKIYWIIFPATITYVVWFFYQYPYGGTINDWYENMSIAFGIGNGAFRWETFSVFTFLFSLSVTSLFFAFTLAKEKEKPNSFTKSLFVYTVKNIWRIIPIVGGILLLIQLNLGLIVLASLLMPFVLALSFPGAFENRKLFMGIGRGLSIGKSGWASGLGLFFVFLFILGLIFFFAVGPVQDLIKMVLNWFLVSSTDDYFLIMNIVEACIYVTIAHFIFPLFFVAFNILYFSIVEKEEAHGLFEKLKDFGKASKVYEDEDEGDF